MNPLNQNPRHMKCRWCCNDAAEYYNDQWLCQDHLDEELEDEEL